MSEKVSNDAEVCAGDGVQFVKGEKVLAWACPDGSDDCEWMLLIYDAPNPKRPGKHILLLPDERLKIEYRLYDTLTHIRKLPDAPE